MLGDKDEESVFDRLWEMIGGGKIRERFGFMIPLWIIRRPETLTILDYRPTFLMFMTVVGFAALAILFVLFFFNIDTGFSYVLWAPVPPAIFCVFLLFRGTIREVYYFDKTNDSYTFIRQFIHRKEVIEGTLSQFTGAYVKTAEHKNSESYENSKSYFVVLKQEGMFLTGVSEQTLREEVPIFNSFDREAKIASAISGFLSSTT
jgi:hypothetical protein